MTDITEAGKTGLSAPPTVPDALRMGAEFAESPATAEPQKPPIESATPSAKVFREIDLKDGSGVQRFEAETYEALVDKLAQAQENATKKIRELSARKPIEPEREVKPAFEVKPPTEAEILALKEGFDADPVTAWKKMFQTFTGESPEEYQQRRASMEADTQRKSAETAFVNAHKKDFYNCPENAAKIGEFLTKEQLPVTKKNLEYAYQNLQESFVTQVSAPPLVAALPPPPPVPTVRDIPPPPVTIPARFGDRPMDPSGDGGVNAAEMAQIATLPPEQMKARIEQLFRKQRGQAG